MILSDAIPGDSFAETEHWTRPDGSAARRLKYRRLSLSLDEEWNLDGYGDAPDWWSALGRLRRITWIELERRLLTQAGNQPSVTQIR